MVEAIDLIVKILTLLTLLSALIFGILRFGLKRERYTFLQIKVEAKPVKTLRNSSLVMKTVHLENVGDRRIDSKRDRLGDGCIYNDSFDVCRHAGTLKIRPIPESSKPTFVDWYSLSPYQSTDGLDYEQINYLDEYQDPRTDYKDVDFWLEPHVSEEFSVFLRLKPGVYAIKAYFFGPVTKAREEEYWSCQTLLNLTR